MGREHDLLAGLRRARRTAARARAALALSWILAAALGPASAADRGVAFAGFGFILLTALVQLVLPADRWLVVEESVAPISAVLIVGFGPDHVTARLLVWLCCVACGVLARGGRRHWSGRAVLLFSLALPVALHARLTWSYAVFALSTVVLLLTCGRITRELRALLEVAQRQIDHDGLTGVLSRSGFRDELQRVAAQLTAPGGPPLDAAALLLVDLDGFGQVNKSSGHAAGDALLLAVAQRLVGLLGADAVVGRLGGDEFAAIIRGAGTGAGERAAAALDGLAESPGVRASAGMAMIPRDGHDAEGLLRAVDVALRVAKRGGRHKVSEYAGESFSTGGPDGARDALERLIRGEGLSCAVQPIVAVPTGTVHAYEALARFPAAGPLHWFALADELGLREELELACLERMLRLLPDCPAGAALAVNLSGPLLLDPRVTALLDALPTLRGLIIELTENSLLEESEGLHDEVSRLLERGVRIAVDDVGAGYSGLRQIATLRPSYLKLDRSLVSGIDHDPVRSALVVAMVNWASLTGGHLVAEGVETAEEFDVLIANGVSLVQGFHLARPGPPWPRLAVASAPSEVSSGA